MSILKGIKVDDIEDVTILILNDISMRHGKFGDHIHIAIAERDKTEDDVMAETSENNSICWSTKTTHIDMIIDVPNKKLLEQFINYLQELKEEHYGV